MLTFHHAAVSPVAGLIMLRGRLLQLDVARLRIFLRSHLDGLVIYSQNASATATGYYHPGGLTFGLGRHCNAVSGAQPGAGDGPFEDVCRSSFSGGETDAWRRTGKG